MATIAYKIFKFEPMIKNPIVTIHAFFTSLTFSRISSFAYYIKFIVIQFYNKILFSYTSKESIEMTVTDLHSISSPGTFKPRKLI